jgi:CRP/FNR family transcriptional regulator, cyclic AMP receptor protein
VAARVTHAQLADLVGTTRETTTKVLGDLQDLGVVALRRGRVVVLDVARLHALADAGW